MFGVERSDGAVEGDVGLAVGGEEESGFIAGEEQLIEGGELSGLMMISWHVFLVKKYQRGLAGRRKLGGGGAEVIQG